MDGYLRILFGMFTSGICRLVSSIDCGESRLTVTTDDTCLTLSPLVPFSRTPGSIIRYSCATLLTGLRESEIDFCPVEICQDNGKWSTASLSCAVNECYPRGKSEAYKGRRKCTVNGHACEIWRNHGYSGQDHRYCRDPGGEKGAPWCHIKATSVPVPWEFCDVPICDEKRLETACDEEYVESCNLPDMTVKVDHDCTGIKSLPIYSMDVGSSIHFRCSYIQANLQSSTGYCPVQVCQTNGRWSAASISCGENECYEAGRSHEYKGHRSCTSSGRQCQAWESQFPHMHELKATSFPGENMTGSYCRDPDRLRGTPWCFTLDPEIEWEDCSVDLCDEIELVSTKCSILSEQDVGIGYPAPSDKYLHIPSDSDQFIQQTESTLNRNEQILSSAYIYHSNDLPVSTTVLHSNDQPISTVYTFHSNDHPVSTAVLHSNDQPASTTVLHSNDQQISTTVLHSNDQQISTTVLHSNDQQISTTVLHSNDQQISTVVLHSNDQQLSTAVLHSNDQQISTTVFHSNDQSVSVIYTHHSNAQHVLSVETIQSYNKETESKYTAGSHEQHLPSEETPNTYSQVTSVPSQQTFRHEYKKTTVNDIDTLGYLVAKETTQGGLFSEFSDKDAYTSPVLIKANFGPESFLKTTTFEMFNDAYIMQSGINNFMFPYLSSNLVSKTESDTEMDPLSAESPLPTDVSARARLYSVVEASARNSESFKAFLPEVATSATESESQRLLRYDMYTTSLTSSFRSDSDGPYIDNFYTNEAVPNTLRYEVVTSVRYDGGPMGGSSGLDRLSTQDSFVDIKAEQHTPSQNSDIRRSLNEVTGSTTKVLMDEGSVSNSHQIRPSYDSIPSSIHAATSPLPVTSAAGNGIYPSSVKHRPHIDYTDRSENGNEEMIPTDKWADHV
ncbi:uncharacterized protein LOC117340434 [Pecten maximus]|uniref:uncharacterized protein LOC117340434 n=1 Tax=Pecten maximus TaxID=6579 RepID=UPI0014580E46|nr:uncharacterized protein LOC117340434 [Pecten maximus]